MQESSANLAGLARKIFGDSIKELSSHGDLRKKFKVVVFTPAENADELTFAMASGGAGKIGDYTVCSFRSKGVGTFMGGESTTPAVGEKGRFEMAEEVRLEMICNRKNLKSVIGKMLEVHPYEEPAFEVYRVMTASPALKVSLKKPVKLDGLLKEINTKIKSTIPGSEKIKIREAIISPAGAKISGKGSSRKNKTLLITKQESGSIKIKLI